MLNVECLWRVARAWVLPPRCTAAWLGAQRRHRAFSGKQNAPSIVYMTLDVGLGLR